MLGVWLVWVATVVAAGWDDGATRVGVPADLSAYQAARKAAGHDAGAHVRLALWCEQHGMTAERMEHLAEAVAQDPTNGLARGLLGMVAFNGNWERPDDIGRLSKADAALSARLAEYNRRRERLERTADAHWKLSLWCEQVGLKAEAKAHLAAVTQLEPGREAAWKHLGFKKVGGRWVTEAQLTAERIESKAQRQADAHWKPLLARWRLGLASKNKVRKQVSEEALAGLTEPRAVPAIWAVLVSGEGTPQAKAVQVLGQIDSPSASRALAMLTIVGRSAEVRRAAAEVLRLRDPRDFLGLLIGMVRNPLKYEVRPATQRNMPGQLFIEGERYNVSRSYTMTETTYNRIMSFAPRFFDSSIPFDPFGPQNMWLLMSGGGPPGMMGQSTFVQPIAPLSAPPHAAVGSPAAKALTAAGNQGPQQALINNEVFNAQVMAAQRDMVIGQQMIAAEQVFALSWQQLRDDVQAVEDYNTDARRINDLAVPVLTSLTGEELGASHEAWQAWWSDQRGYVYPTADSSSKPTYTEFIPSPWDLHSCFGAGTLVHTLDGPRAIELIRTGDRVLSQDSRTGRLAFTAIVAAFHNKPAATLRIKLEDQTIIATGIHRFWRVGKGWTMARELKRGDRLRVIGGTARVVALDADKVQPVFNLEVADGQSFFVGRLGVLVHDNSEVQPVPLPFDAIASQSGPTSRMSTRSMLGH